MTVALKLVINNFIEEVQTNESLTADEVKASLAFAAFQKNSISSIIRFAITVANQLNAGGRTQLSLKNLAKIVVVAAVTAVVSALVVTVAVTVGAGILASAGVAIAWGTVIEVGAIVGGVYGLIVGIDKSANRNQCFTDFNPKNIRGAFLDWDVCPI